MSKVIILFLGLFSVNVFSQVYIRTWLGEMRDTAFILPGESFTNFINISNVSTGGESTKVEMTSCILYVNDIFPSPNILSSDIHLSAPLMSDSSGGFNFFVGDVYHGRRMIKVLPKSSNDYFRNMTIGRVQFYSKGILGEAYQTYALEAESQSGDALSYNSNLNLLKKVYYKFVNRIRGDINGDGVVDFLDRDIAANYSGNQMHASIPINRFSRSDEDNIGAIILPGHSSPTILTGPRLLNIWLNNPDDPAVVNIGWGRPMSETLPAIKSGALAKPSSERFAWSLEGNVLEVETRPYAAVNAFAFKSDGTMWQKDGFADEAGYWETEVNDTNLDYQVEVCDLIGGPVNGSVPVVNQQETTINMAIASKSYDLMGRRTQDQKSNLQVVVQNNIPMLSFH